MLKTIYCNKFKQKSDIIFTEGLNVILGDENASNSIGKSTFLMILDFIFGGSDYLTKCANDILHVGEHEIFFSFEFDKMYFFMRNTKDGKTVFECDGNKIITGSMTLDEYNKFLNTKMNSNLHISFRNFVGRFSRVFGKDNLTVKKPLNIVSNERSGDPIDALMKMVDSYSDILPLVNSAKETDQNLSAFDNARKRNYIPRITKKQYLDNKQLIAYNDEKKKLIIENLNKKQSEINALMSDELLDLKNQRKDLVDKKVFLERNQKNAEYRLHSNTLFKEQYEELKEFFSDINLSKLSEIDFFHNKLTANLKNEIRDYKSSLSIQIEAVDEYLRNIELRIDELSPKDGVDSSTLELFSNYRIDNERRTRENNFYEQHLALEGQKKSAVENLQKAKNELLVDIVTNVNKEMASINDIVTESIKTSPILKIDKNEYSLIVQDDNGTGAGYRGMIEFDLAILNLTCLPFIIHDSILFKNIGTDYMQNIIKYYKNYKSQIFISIDEINKYTEDVRAILNDSSVIKLGKEKEALFGRTWNTVKK